MPDIFLRAGEPSPSDVRLRNPALLDATGTVAIGFGMTEAAVATETFSGQADEAFSFALALTGTETVSGMAAVTFGMTEAATATETFSGTAVEAFGFGVAAAGATSTPVDGSIDVAFGFEVSVNATMPTGHGWGVVDAVPIGLRYEPFEPPAPLVIKRKKPALVPVHGYADVAFGFGVAAAADVNDDELAFALALT